MNVYSYHIFIFPFSWNKDKKIDKNDILNCGWIEDTVDDKEQNYNERKYFYEFVHPVLFVGNENKSDKRLVSKYVYKDCIEGLWNYIINLNVRQIEKQRESLFKDEIVKPPINYNFMENKRYTLKISKITLDIYSSGVGIFAFHLENTEYENPYDILLINQFGRRLFPPFLDKHFKDFKIEKIGEDIDGTKYRELPNSITINVNGKDVAIERFKETISTETNESFNNIPRHIKCFFQYINKSNKNLLNDNNLKIKYVLDDRMFVMCWYGSKQLSYDFRKQKLTPKVEKDKYQYALSDLCQPMPGGYEVSGFYRNNKDHKSLVLNETHNSYGYAHNDFWYQYVFVDGYGLSCANRKLRTEQIEKHTYARWVEANSLYGITRYSFVCISEPKDILEKPFPNAGFIVDNFKTIYFKMVSLVLVQRAMVLDFSSRIEKIELKENLKDSDKKLALDAYSDYRNFINKIFHREITAQEQGIEIYDMLQEHLRVELQAKELEKEFLEMHRLIDLVGTSDTNKRMRRLTILTSAFAVFTLIFGLLNSYYFSKLDRLPFNDLLNFNFVFDYNSIHTVLYVTSIAYFAIYTFVFWNKNITKYIFLFISIILLIIFISTFNFIFTSGYSIAFDLSIIIITFLSATIVSFLTKKR